MELGGIGSDAFGLAEATLVALEEVVSVHKYFLSLRSPTSFVSLKKSVFVVRIGRRPRRGRCRRGRASAEIVFIFEKSPTPKTTRSEAPGRSILRALCDSVVKHNPVYPVNPVHKFYRCVFATLREDHNSVNRVNRVKTWM